MSIKIANSTGPSVKLQSVRIDISGEDLVRFKVAIFNAHVQQDYSTTVRNNQIVSSPQVVPLTILRMARINACGIHSRL